MSGSGLGEWRTSQSLRGSNKRREMEGFQDRCDHCYFLRENLKELNLTEGPLLGDKCHIHFSANHSWLL